MNASNTSATGRRINIPVFTTGKPMLIRRPNRDAYPADRYSQNPVEGSPKSSCLTPLTSHVLDAALGWERLSMQLPEHREALKAKGLLEDE